MTVNIQRGVMVPMRDGVRLATDLYLPSGQHPAPVLLERTPYGRDMSRRVLDAQFFAHHGYAVAMQDVRGRYDSEGSWRPFLDDPEDGHDTIQWLASRPWCDGRVGTMGASYAGTIQSGAASLNPPALRAMVMVTAAADAFSAAMRQGGAMELRWVSFVFNMAATSREACADPLLAQALREAAANLEPWLRQPPTRPGQTPLRALPNYERWLIDLLTHTERDAFWRQRCFAPLDFLERYADVPTLHVGGWYDSYAGATCELFNRLRAAKRSRQCLAMGPWEHTAMEDRVAGELDFGAEAIRHHNLMRLAWFDRYLKDRPGEVDDWPDVQVFVMGGGSGRRTALGHVDRGGSWREDEQFPPAAARFASYYLHRGGSLQTVAPVGGASPSRFVFDPAHPVPSIGGCVSAAPAYLRPGGYDQRARKGWVACEDERPLAERQDVLCFLTDPLPQPLRIIGPIAVELFVASTAADADFTAKLVEVYPASVEHPQGLAINLTDGIRRVRGLTGITRVMIDLYSTACVVAAGHRLRLDISGSNFPRFDLNPAAEKGEQTVHHDQAHGSRVILPVVR